MCGIGGFIKEAKINDEFLREVVIDLTTRLQVRGSDATGVFTSVGNGILRKEPVPATKFKDYPLNYGRVTLVHARQATHGSPKVFYNNHPILSDNYVMVHNGIVWMDRLKDYNYRGEVDSEILLSYIEKKGIKEGLASLEGTAAAAFCKRFSPNKVWLYGSPIFMSYIPGSGILFGSTPEIARPVVRKFWKHWLGIFTAGASYVVDEDELLEIDLETMKITSEKIKVKKTKYWNGWRGGSNGYLNNGFQVYSGRRVLTVSTASDNRAPLSDASAAAAVEVKLREEASAVRKYSAYAICDFCGISNWTRQTKDKLNICQSCDLLLGDDAEEPLVVETAAGGTPSGSSDEDG